MAGKQASLIKPIILSDQTLLFNKFLYPAIYFMLYLKILDIALGKSKTFALFTNNLK